MCSLVRIQIPNLAFTSYLNSDTESLPTCVPFTYFHILLHAYFCRLLFLIKQKPRIGSSFRAVPEVLWNDPLVTQQEAVPCSRRSTLHGCVSPGPDIHMDIFGWKMTLFIPQNPFASFLDQS